MPIIPNSHGNQCFIQKYDVFVLSGTKVTFICMNGNQLAIEIAAFFSALEELVVYTIECEETDGDRAAEIQVTFDILFKYTQSCDIVRTPSLGEGKKLYGLYWGCVPLSNRKIN